MRFAVSLLTVLAIASVIGTVLKQAEPYPNYVAQFGQFWFPVFDVLGLYDVYQTGWFLVILTFLVASTSLCVYRNGPLMLREMRSYREQASEASLRHFTHRAEFDCATDGVSSLERLQHYLAAQGFRFRVRNASGENLLISAKVGSYHRLGYILTHCAIVIICLGGLLDGNLPLKLMQLSGHNRRCRRAADCRRPICRSAAMSPFRKAAAPMSCS
jgi:cytochrome c biogenesis protein